MRKVHIVFASIFGGLAVIFVLVGLGAVVAPDPLYIGGYGRSFLSDYDGSDPDAHTVARMLPYLAGQVLGIGLICASLVFAVISNAFINLLVGFKRSKLPPASTPAANQ